MSPTPDRAKAVILLSGGLDSATALALAAREGFWTHALTIDYGQRHAQEVAAAGRVARAAAVAEHVVLNLDLRGFGGSALTDDSIDVPRGRDTDEMADGIPVTYVPARNTVFLSCALAWCEALGAGDIFIGVNALDYSGYPDCRPAFIAAFEKLAAVATKAGVEGRGPKIHAPLIEMSKAEIIRTGAELGVDFADTVSCYDPIGEGLACGACDSCQLRRKGFREAGVPDTTRYAAGGETRAP
jgi:7-cyano-7-deazaguanine synthase